MKPQNLTQVIRGIAIKDAHSRSAQRGISLMIVLIALVMMSLAAVGLIRMVDTGTLVVGNVAFKQSTTSVADRGVEDGIKFIQKENVGPALYQNIPQFGYYASSLDELDASGNSDRPTRVLVDWYGNNCAYAASGSFATCIQPTGENDSNGYTTRFVITRMCKTVGDPNATGNGCAKPISNADNQSPKRGEVKYGEDKRFGNPAGPYFRIIVRSEGPRNTLSFTETYVHF
jgi:Tfp pilus assembly protein PilX